MSKRSFVDYYALLGTELSATGAEVRRSYMRHAKALHPDLDGGDAEKMQQLNQAYQTLKDDSKRRAYDLMHQAETGTEMLRYRYEADGENNALISNLTDDEVDDFLNSVVSDFRAENPPQRPLRALRKHITFGRVSKRKPPKS
ncbi:DnaJ domain-containing protein [Candidatus Saccharibacteria bacterium]|nr:DnaJ domain-containing protein [Candidatus Saccharibacteria bacterium]